MPTKRRKQQSSKHNAISSEKSEEKSSSSLSLPVLKSAKELPDWRTPRPHILSGYRVGYSPLQAALSIFSLHNETGNVLSHFIPLWIVVFCAIHLYSAVISTMWHHRALFLVFVIANFMVFIFSTLYHLMSCVSKRFYEVTMFLDYFSISVLLVASFIPSIYFAFACHYWERVCYLTMISVLGSISLVMPWFKFFDSPKFTPYRIGLFCLTGLSGVLPAIHSAIIFPIDFSVRAGTAIASPINASSVIHWGVALMFLFYALGVIFYLTRFPESMFPGHFDLSLFFQSHTLWHICVACAAIVHFFTCVGIYQRFSTIGECPA